jgi:hypothetical protein
LASTIVTPPMLRALFAEPKKKLEEPAEEGKEA